MLPPPPPPWPNHHDVNQAYLLIVYRHVQVHVPSVHTEHSDIVKFIIEINSSFSETFYSAPFRAQRYALTFS